MDEKVYSPTVIPDTPFPGQDGTPSPDVTSSGGKDQIYTQTTTPELPFPTQRVAQQLISDVLNTKTRKILGEFSFTPSGAIRIGDYKAGNTGDISLSPDGIVARNSQGDTTFALDGITGDATFKGTIQAGTVIAFAIDGQLITAGTVTADKLSTSYIQVGGGAADVNAGVTTISGGKITAASIAADRLNVSTLSAITANLGTVTAGSITGLTITGGTIRTASSGSRVELLGSDSALHVYSGSNELIRLDSGGLHGYNTSGTEQVRISSSDGIAIYGSIGQSLLIKDTPSGSTYGILGYDSSAGELLFASASSKALHLRGALGMNVEVVSGNISMTLNGGTFTVSGAASITGAATVAGALVVGGRVTVGDSMLFFPSSKFLKMNKSMITDSGNPGFGNSERLIMEGGAELWTKDNWRYAFGDGHIYASSGGGTFNLIV